MHCPVRTLDLVTILCCCYVTGVGYAICYDVAAWPQPHTPFTFGYGVDSQVVIDCCYLPVIPAIYMLIRSRYSVDLVVTRCYPTFIYVPTIYGYVTVGDLPLTHLRYGCRALPHVPQLVMTGVYRWKIPGYDCRTLLRYVTITLVVDSVYLTTRTFVVL